MNKAPLLSISNLSFHYPGARGNRNTLERIELEIFGGDRIGMLGESGSGKTTLSLILAGLERPSTGLFLFNGKRLLGRKAYRDYRKKIQYLFQDPMEAVNRYRKVFEIVSEPLTYRITKKEAIVSIVSELLKTVGIDPLRWHDYPDQLSLGQIQRVCLARAMTTNPEMLICDEPFSALDVSNCGKMKEILLQLNANHGVTLFIISHEPKSLFKLCQKILVLHKGKIIELIDTTRGEHAQHEYSRKLLEINTT